METMTIPVSEDILSAANMSKDEMAAAMSRDYAIKMFAEGRLTMTQSANLCGMNIFDFLDALARAGVPAAVSEAEDLEKELAYFRTFSGFAASFILLYFRFPLPAHIEVGEGVTMPGNTLNTNQHTARQSHAVCCSHKVFIFGFLSSFPVLAS
jgi:predicted HTH domain antitoxin